jgi:pimeloyl-ACP methyl ester carboxylesterase
MDVQLRYQIIALTCVLGACASLPTPEQFSTSCPQLTGKLLAANEIALPSRGARIVSATLMPASSSAPLHCKVLGQVTSIDPAAKPIEFQVNLPAQWNSKALQYGGGGFNGTLVSGMTPLRDAAPTDALPIARGYVTYGTDSGHKVTDYPAGEPGAFALNDEMLENFAYASYKKVKDVAVSVMTSLYGKRPSKVYYVGGSEGGREGLAMAQRFPADLDGVISVVPVVNWSGLFHAFVRNQQPLLSGGFNPAKVALVAKATNAACDALDGLVDGVVNNYQACQGKVNLSALRCPEGADSGAHCLSDTDLNLLQLLHSPTTFPFALANGLTSYPAWWYGHEDSLDGPTAPSFVRWVSGRATPGVPPDAATTSTHWLYGSSWIRYAILRDALGDVAWYDPAAHQERVQRTSALMDATNPDLKPFFARGGKLILRENAGDRAQSPQMGIEYFGAMEAAVGKAQAEASARLYVSPASTHTGNAQSVTTRAAVPTMADLLDLLDAWVSQGKAPPDAIVQTSHAGQAPFAVQASRPMCRFPAYPHYVGGQTNLASSYSCRVAQ